MFEGPWIFTGKRFPRKLSDTLLIVSDFRPRVEQWLQFVGRQLSKATKYGAAGDAFRANQSQLCRAEVARRIPIEVVEKVRLTEEIVRDTRPVKAGAYVRFSCRTRGSRSSS